MADDAEIEAEGGGGAGRSRLAMIVAGVAALLAVGSGVGFGVSKLMGSDAPAGDAAAAEAGAQGGEAPSASSASAEGELLAPMTEVIALGNFTVNLRDSAGGRLLQMDISVECTSDVGSMVQEKEAQIRDAVLMLASDYTWLELEGIDGKMRLRDETHRRINAVLNPHKVNRVYFTAFVVQ